MTTNKFRVGQTGELRSGIVFRIIKDLKTMQLEALLETDAILTLAQIRAIGFTINDS